MGRDTDTRGTAGGAAGDDKPGSDRRKTAGGIPRGPGKRGVDKKFKWTHGHDPNDPDTWEGSGWQYITWEFSEGEETVPDQTKGLGGGPEAFPCDRCGEIMRIVARKKPSEILEESQVVKLREDTDLSAMDTDEIFLVACPKCQQKVQMPGTHVRRLRQIKLGRPL